MRRSVRSVLFRASSGFTSIASLFAGGYVGDWFDISDKSKLWVTSPTTTQVANDGDLIGQFRGQVNALDFIQTTAANKPIWHTGDFATFDGTNDRVSRTIGGEINLYASVGATIIAVVKGNPGVNTYLFSEGSGVDNNPMYGIMGAANTAADLSSHIRGDDAVIQKNNTATIVAGVWNNTMKVVAVRDSGTQIIVNINNGAPTTSGYTRSGALTAAGSTLGAMRRATPIGFFAMDLAQLLVINRYLSDAELVGACSFLGAKQSLTI